jgi:hypothetical protein
MKTPSAIMRLGMPVVLLCAGRAAVAQPEIPEPLRPWEAWATWDEKHRDCPTPYHTPETHICFWPTTLSMSADGGAGSWDLGVTVYDDTWVPLPGDPEMWPIEVRANEAEIVVVERDGRPSVRLTNGTYRLTGAFSWEEMPQHIGIPIEIGVLSLTLEGNTVEIPNWDTAGRLWLKRKRAEATDEDQLAVQVYRVIEDGIPLWLRTEIELSVSGKSREEELGWVLPAGWTLATVDSPVPIAVDDEGRLKAQVRAGKWTVALHAFRTSDPGEVAFAESATPIIDRELVAFKARPSFRMAEFEGLRPVDVSQTTFPEKWRSFPVFEWATGTPFRLVEKMRGMGLQRPAGLAINREFWLDEDGQGLTFLDTVQGQMQQVWRLDIADGHELGAVRVEGKGQLITTNPNTGAHGVEIRARNLNLQAVGRMDQVADVSAIGWQTDVDSLQMKLNLPPGWRLFALFGADWVSGDWLTTWSLLDLFLLLIFSMAVFRLWGWKAGIVAVLAFGLAYHEPGAPRFTWLFLLMPLALLRVVTKGAGRKWVVAWRFLAVALLVLWLVPFAATQIQSVIYPQLEKRGMNYRPSGLFGAAGGMRMQRAPMQSRLGGQDAGGVLGVPAEMKEQMALEEPASSREYFGTVSLFSTSNLRYDPKARIQTGPAEPEWTWNWVQCGWNGPVSAEQQIRPVFISLPVHRVLTVVRVALLILLAGLLLGMRRMGNPLSKRSVAAALALMFVGMPDPAVAELPDAETLSVLRARLLQPSDAYPNGAEIPEVTLKLSDGRIAMEAEIHCAVRGAVPLPGKLPSWSPLTVTVNGAAGAPLRRQGGYLWVVLDEGVQRVRMEGLLPAATEWAWTFQLKPKRVTIDAPGWNVTGVRPNGIPEQQVFFARQRERTEEEAAYDRKEFNVVAAVDRYLEVGLNWQVRTVVTRLSSSGKAVSFRVPLLPGEKVLTSNAVLEGGAIEVRLGAGMDSYTWSSELPIGGDIPLVAPETDRWVERWYLVTSPVWNAALSGVDPVFEPQEQNLVPVWHPWPGEAVTLSFSKPEAVTGETITARRVRHETTLGSRQRTTKLHVEVECSLGDDFVIGLDPESDITSLKQDGQEIPVRREGGNLVVPVHPGQQKLDVDWRTDEAMGVSVQAGAVTLPVEAANITTVIRVPDSRWVLWAGGPRRGPAVRFWTILALAIVAAMVLGSLRLSPIGRLQWILLGLGLTQVHLVPALIVVSWFFLMASRGKPGLIELPGWRFNMMQVFVLFWSAVSLGVLVVAVGEGLLGNPEMFIRGNGSSRTMLQWFQPAAGTALPTPVVISVSVWFYRLLMLAWALWLAAALLRWLKWGWNQFSHEGCWKRMGKKKEKAPPALPDRQV